MDLLKNKVAIVTGGGSGIGREVAYKLASEGACVLVSDLNEDGGAQTVWHIKDRKGDAIFYQADSAKPEDSETLVKEAISAWGRLDIAVNNAGIAGASALTGAYPLNDWQKVLDVNLSGVFYGMRYQIPAMLDSGGGAIVNMASVLGRVGFPQSAAYVAAKHGVIGLTESAALEYAAQGLRINCVGPGFIKTPLLDKNLASDAIRKITDLHPIGRLGEPSEVAELVLWLSSAKASFVTGSYYAIDGGYLAR